MLNLNSQVYEEEVYSPNSDIISDLWLYNP